MAAPPLGRRTWVIPEGWIPEPGSSRDPSLQSHETACLLNAGDEPAEVELTVYFEDREPSGPYRLRVPARRTLHLQFNTLEDPEPIPRRVAYASVFRSSVPIVVQHTRLDAREEGHSLLSTMAWPAS